MSSEKELGVSKTELAKAIEWIRDHREHFDIGYQFGIADHGRERCECLELIRKRFWKEAENS